MSLVCTFLGLWTLATRFFTLFLYDHIAAVSTHGKQSVVLFHPGLHRTDGHGHKCHVSLDDCSTPGQLARLQALNLTRH